MRHSNRYRDFLLYILYNSNSLGMNRKVVGIHFKNEKEKSVMSRNVKEIIDNCREAKEEMSLSDFKTCIDAIYFHIGQAFKYEDASQMCNQHLKIATNICLATSDCFLDEKDNLTNWFKGDKCSFIHPDTRKEVEIRVRDDYEAIYYFLRYCMKLKKREEIGEDFFNYLVYILCEPCLP